MTTKSNIDFDIVINNKIAPTYNDPISEDLYIEGREGSDYILRIKNRNYHRVLIVLSVDGLSIMDGKEADMHQSNGYVLNAYQTIDIPGWRLNDSEVAKFTFSKVGSSYAVKSSGNANNVGVIGMAVFKEKYYTSNTYRGSTGISPYNDLIWSSYGMGSLRSMSTVNTSCTVGAAGAVSANATMDSNPIEQSVGTEFGDCENFNTVSTTFTKGDLLTMFEIYYDSASGLMDRGININPNKPKKVKPSAFPKYDCQPPADWQPRR